MSTSNEGTLEGLNMEGWKRGRIVNRSDDSSEGRVGVFVPSLVLDYPQDSNAPVSTQAGLKPNFFSNASELRMNTAVKRDNWIWARPASHLVEKGLIGGNYRVPTLGTEVWVFFEDGDPNKAYYLTGTPTIAGQVIAGANIGKGTEAAVSGANWKDPAKRPNIEVISELKDGTIVYADYNDGNSGFFIRMANGHTFALYNNGKSGAYIETGGGASVHLDDTNNIVKITHQEGTTTMTMYGDKSVITNDVDIIGNLTVSKNTDITGATTVGKNLSVGGSIGTLSGGAGNSKTIIRNEVLVENQMTVQGSIRSSSAMHAPDFIRG